MGPPPKFQSVLACWDRYSLLPAHGPLVPSPALPGASLGQALIPIPTIGPKHLGEFRPHKLSQHPWASVASELWGILCLSGKSIEQMPKASFRVKAYMHINTFIPKDIHLPTYPFTHSFIHPSTHPPTYPPIHSPIQPSTHPLIHPPTYSSTHPSIHPLTYPSIGSSGLVSILCSTCSSSATASSPPTFTPAGDQVLPCAQFLYSIQIPWTTLPLPAMGELLCSWR